MLFHKSCKTYCWGPFKKFINLQGWKAWEGKLTCVIANQVDHKTLTLWKMLDEEATRFIPYTCEICSILGEYLTGLNWGKTIVSCLFSSIPHWRTRAQFEWKNHFTVVTNLSSYIDWFVYTWLWMHFFMCFLDKEWMAILDE